jgi:hypothetical protein
VQLHVLVIANVDCRMNLKLQADEYSNRHRVDLSHTIKLHNELSAPSNLRCSAPVLRTRNLTALISNARVSSLWRVSPRLETTFESPERGGAAAGRLCKNCPLSRKPISLFGPRTGCVVRSGGRRQDFIIDCLRRFRRWPREQSRLLSLRTTGKTLYGPHVRVALDTVRVNRRATLELADRYAGQRANELGILLLTSIGTGW